MNFEDELKRRMLLARTQGWNEAEVQRSALIERGLQRKRAAEQSAAAAKPKGAGRAGGAKGFLLDVTPFGRVAEKVINPEAGDITAGELGMETLLTVAPFGIGRVAKAGKAAKAAKTATKTNKQISKRTNIPEPTVREATPSPAPQPGSLPSDIKDLFAVRPDGMLERGGRKVRGYGRGVQTGVRPEGVAERLQPKDADRFNRLLDDIGAKGSVPQQMERVDVVQEQARQMIDQAVQAKNAPISRAQLKTLAGRVRTNVLGVNGRGVPGYNERLHGRLIADLERQAGTATDVVGIENFRKSLDDIINYSRNPASPDPMSERIAQAYRREIDELVTALVPEAKQAKGLYAGLEGAKDVLVVNAPMSLQQTAGTGGLFSKLFSSAATQKALSGAGRSMEFAGRNMSRPVVALPAGQAGVRIGADAMGLRPDGQPQQDELSADLQLAFPDAQTEDELILNEMLGAGADGFDELAMALDGGGMGGMDPAGAPGTAGPTGLEHSSAELFDGAMRALMAGDEKTFKALSAAADQAAMLEKQAASMSGPGKMSAAAQKQLMGVNTADQLVSQIEQEIAQVPSGLVGGFGASLVGKFKPNEGSGAAAEAYNQSRGSKALMLIKAIQGSAGQISDVDRDMIMNAMPLAQDSEEIRRRKIQSIRNIIAAYRGSVQTAPAANDELPEDVMQLMGGSMAYAY